MFAHQRVLFEIYREARYDRRYRVVYFTELNEHEREREIAHVLAGDHFHDGFLRADALPEAKRTIGRFLQRLNSGEVVEAAVVAQALREYLAVLEA
jgi:hypothetical protein